MEFIIADEIAEPTEPLLMEEHRNIARPFLFPIHRHPGHAHFPGVLFFIMKARGGSNLPVPLELWRQIELACVAGMSYGEAAKQFDIKPNTIRAKAVRNNWPTPTNIAKRAKELAAKPSASTALDKVAENWQEKAESHRVTVFEKTSKAIAGSNLRPPKNWRDFDIVDKAARRSAGLDNTEVLQQTLVNINEISEGEITDLNLVRASTVDVGCTVANQLT